MTHVLLIMTLYEVLRHVLRFVLAPCLVEGNLATCTGCWEVLATMLLKELELTAGVVEGHQKEIFLVCVSVFGKRSMLASNGRARCQLRVFLFRHYQPN